MREEAWRAADDWYWAGPDGWTICRVFVGGAWIYELWRPGQAGRGAAATSFTDALKQYEALGIDKSI